MFTLFEVDDGMIELVSRDSGDFARVFRLLNFDVPLPSKHGIQAVKVTIFRESLDKEDLHAKTQEGGHGPDSAAQLDFDRKTKS